MRDELARLWEELLAVDHVGEHDDFFLVGGHSLLALRLLQRIRDSFGVTVTLADLRHEPTIAHLASVIARGAASASAEELMVELRGGTGTPVFLLHGDFAFGGLYCQRLLRSLGGTRPVQVLHPHQPGGPESVEAMAASYAEHIRAVQPSGPYTIAGVCNGEIIGFELARQLARAGERVETLVMIDARADAVTLAPGLRLLDRLARLLGWSAQRRVAWLREQRALHADVVERHGALAGRPRWLRAAVALGLSARDAARRRLRRGEQVVAAPSRPATDDAQDARYHHIRNAMMAYVPGRYHGSVTLVWPEEEFRTLRPDQLHGWASLADSSELQVIPGGHHSILTRHLPALAATLTARLMVPDPPLPCPATTHHSSNAAGPPHQTTANSGPNACHAPSDGKISRHPSHTPASEPRRRDRPCPAPARRSSARAQSLKRAPRASRCLAR